MPTSPSAMSLHLRYRLWIAEMNSDINVLRIFDDYLAELSCQKNEAEVKSGIADFGKQFVKLRNEIDVMRHEMHLHKMKLAALSREMKPFTYDAYKADTHDALNKRYSAFRKTFGKTKKEFGAFESKWL